MIEVAETERVDLLTIKPAVDQLEDLSELRNIAHINLSHSTQALTFSTRGDTILAIIGIVEMDASSKTFAAWAIVAENAEGYGIALTRKVVDELDQAGSRHDIKTMTMLVHADNHRHMKWANVLGFMQAGDQGIGITGRDYYLMTRYWL